MFLFIVFTCLLLIPAVPNVFIKYNEDNVLSTSSKNYGQLVKINNINKLSKVITVKAFSSQKAYYDNIFELKNYTNQPQPYKIENFVNNNNVAVKVKFSNNLDEILLHPNEKTSISLEVLGAKEDTEVKVFLEIYPR